MDCWTSSSELRKHVLESLKELNITPSNRRGQNFLIDPNIINYQISQANIQTNDIILEIGGGIGNLSKCIVTKAKKLIIIEQDKRLVKFLMKYFQSHSNVEIIQGDAVKTEFPKFTKCISNLPYQISSPITFKLLEHSFQLAVLMYQREFAQRFFAKPGTKDYSRISVMVNLRANCKNLKTVKPTAFYPQPKIFSSILAITRKEETLVEDHDDFSAFIRMLFTNKKKTIRNILFNIIKRKEKKNDPIERSILDSFPFMDRRVFTMTIEDLLQLHSSIKEKKGEKLWSDTISQNMKLSLEIDEDVYFPAEDTLSLLDMIEVPTHTKNIIEIGGGCGIISIVLAKNNPETQFLLTDISFNATKTIENNLLINQVKNQINVICMDKLQAIHNPKAEIIIWNPPYLPDEDGENLDPTSKLMLVGGKKGYEETYAMITYLQKNKINAYFYTIFSSLSWQEKDIQRLLKDGIKLEIIKELSFSFENYI